VELELVSVVLELVSVVLELVVCELVVSELVVSELVDSEEELPVSGSSFEDDEAADEDVEGVAAPSGVVAPSGYSGMRAGKQLFT